MEKYCKYEVERERRRMVWRKNVWYKERKRDPVYGPDEVKQSVSLSVTLVPFTVISNRPYYRLSPPPLYIPSFPSSLHRSLFLYFSQWRLRGGPWPTPRGTCVVLWAAGDFSWNQFMVKVPLPLPQRGPRWRDCSQVGVSLADFGCVLEYLCAFDWLMFRINFLHTLKVGVHFVAL